MTFEMCTLICLVHRHLQRIHSNAPGTGMDRGGVSQRGTCSCFRHHISDVVCLPHVNLADSLSLVYYVPRHDCVVILFIHSLPDHVLGGF